MLKKEDPSMCAFKMMHGSCLCDSAKKISSKFLSQVAGKNVFGQSVCRVLLIFNILKTIWKHIYFMISNN